KIGVSLGHRKILLRAIAALTAAQGFAGSPTAASNEASPSSAHRDAEFRQITVLFCDLVGSAQLSETLEPEDLQKLIDAYRTGCNKAIDRYGGSVARYFGDGIMAFFGWPRAHEDDAVRAVRAAFEVVTYVSQIPGPVALACRIGIALDPSSLATLRIAPVPGRWM